MRSRQTQINTYPETRQPQTRKPYADRPTDTPVAHEDGFFPERGRLNTFLFLGGPKKSAGESHLCAVRSRSVRSPATAFGTQRVISTPKTAGTPASLVSEPRLRDGDKTARVREEGR